MRINGWWVKKIHGSIYQIGLPDLLAYHKEHGHRLIEMKVRPNKLEKSQEKVLMEMFRAGAPVYVLTGEQDYHHLFKPPNVLAFMMYGYDIL